MTQNAWSQPIIEQARKYIEGIFAGNADGHDAAHSLRVYHNAMKISAHYPECNKLLVALAALLHDVDDHKLFATENNANARRFLTGQDVEPSQIEAICENVNAVSFSKNKGKTPATLEGRIVQDADRLDALGAIGVARTFAYGGRNGRTLEDSIEHFHEKLLRLKDIMNTPEGKALAEQRHEFLLAFLNEWESEI